MRKGREHLKASLPRILEDADNKLSGGALRSTFAGTKLQLVMQYLHRQIEESDKLDRARIAGELEPCRRLVAIPGIGVAITASATIAAIGNAGAAFKKGRGFAYCLAGGGARRALHRRQAAAHWYQPTWQQIPAKALRPRSAYRAAAENEAIFRPEYVAGQSIVITASASRWRQWRYCQQDGAHGTGRFLLQGRGLSSPTFTTNRRSLMACT